MRKKNDAKLSPWSPELHKIYEQAVRQLRQKISHGQTYEQAFDTLSDLDHEMRAFIEDDFLKIIIAEEHFGADIPIDDLALFLGLPIRQLEACRDSLLMDMHFESSEHFGKSIFKSP
jgi:hypothetical protein